MYVALDTHMTKLLVDPRNISDEMFGGN